MKIIIVFLVVCQSILLTTSSCADEFVVGVENIEYYPIYSQKEGEYIGYARALMDAFAKKEGHTFTYKALPIKRLFHNFINGKLDFKFPDNANWKRDIKKGKGVIYSDSALEYIDGVFVLPRAMGKGKTNLKKVGVVRGFTAWQNVDDVVDRKVNVREVISIESLIKMVKLGRIDGAYVNVAVAESVLENMTENKNRLVFDRNLPHTQGYYHLSTIKHPKIIKSFNQFLKNNKSLVESLKVKYGVKL